MSHKNDLIKIWMDEVHTDIQAAQRDLLKIAFDEVPSRMDVHNLIARLENALDFANKIAESVNINN